MSFWVKISHIVFGENVLSFRFMYFVQISVNLGHKSIAQTYSEPYQTSKTENFSKIVKLLTISAKQSILDVWQFRNVPLQRADWFSPCE